MFRNKFITPLSTLLRSLYPSNVCCSISQISTPFSSSHPFDVKEPESFKILLRTRFHFLFNCNFLGKNQFCSESVEKLRCWSCNVVAGNTLPFLVCDSCRTVQPVNDSVDYFQIFGLEKKYEMEEDNLEGKYKNWQKKLHPDLVHSKSEKEREYAAEQSARVIDAYRTLINPLARAIYILKLGGLDVDEEERISDLELLAEIMEIREAVEAASDTQLLEQIQAEMQEKLRHWSKSFADAFRHRNFEGALNAVRRMTYYKRATEEIIKKL